jgi:hypothetical protein
MANPCNQLNLRPNHLRLEKRKLYQSYVNDGLSSAEFGRGRINFVSDNARGERWVQYSPDSDVSSTGHRVLIFGATATRAFAVNPSAQSELLDERLLCSGVWKGQKGVTRPRTSMVRRPGRVVLTTPVRGR